MSDSRHRARAHARRAYCCSCGRVVHGNGAKHSHRAKHQRAGDTHGYISMEEFDRRFPDGRRFGITEAREGQ